jgi:hypothetical protein
LDRLARVWSLLLAEAEPSKVPFYLAGGVLALWAVVLAGIGLTRPSFPFNATGQRAVIGISLILMLVAIAMAIVTSK